MARYDSNIIQTFADRLYARAKAIIAMSTVVGMLVAASAGYAVGDLIINPLLKAGNTQILLGLCGAFIGAVVGYVIGEQWAFMLKLQAQTALCQVRIEENTKMTAEHTEILADMAITPKPVTPEKPVVLEGKSADFHNVHEEQDQEEPQEEYMEE